MKNLKTYVEKKILHKGDKCLLGARIVEYFKDRTYGLYELPNEVTIGIGMAASIVAKKYDITLRCDTVKKYDIKNDLSSAIDKAFKELTIVGWRAYGLAYFGLARYNFGLELNKESDILLEAFIPTIEIRIYDEEILIRSLDAEVIEEISNRVNEIANDIERYKYSNNKILSNASLLSAHEEYYKSLVLKGVQEIKEQKYKKVIFSRKMSLTSRVNMIESYMKGRSVNTPARSYLFSFAGLEVVGFSPETIVEVDCNGEVSTLPLAGTRALTQDGEKNTQLKMELLTDAKEIAEHAISVKLAFEELAEVCEKDTIRCVQYMDIMERGTVQHIGSRVCGKLKASNCSWHAFNTLFPAITASGIPKQESIDAIGRLEEEPRELYSGSVFTYDEQGMLDSALVLRTIFQNSRESWVRVGAGIVEMSTAEREFEETCEKLRSFSRQLFAEE